MRMTLTFALFISLLLACGQKHAGGHGSHEFDPLHEGQLLHVADHGPILEIVHDEAAGTATLYVFDAHQTQKSIEKAPVLLIPGQKNPIPATGKADVWVFSHAELKKHQHDMRIRITIDGKEFNPDWHPVH